MRTQLLVCCFAFLVAGCDGNKPNQSSSVELNPTTEPADSVIELSESDRLTHWFDDRMEELFARRPIYLTLLGRKERYDQIGDYSVEANDTEIQWWRETAAELQSEFDYSKLDASSRVSYQLWMNSVEEELALHPYHLAIGFNWSPYVFNQFASPQVDMPEWLINNHRVDDESDMRAYIRRIAGVSRALNQLMEHAKSDAAKGIRAPRFAYEVIIAESMKQIGGRPFDSTDADAPLWSDAVTKIDALLEAGTINEATAQDLRRESKQALIEHFQPTYKTIINWFESDLENTDAKPQGVGALPDGEALYRSMLKLHTTLDLSPDEVHETGIAEVERILLEIDGIIEEVGFEGSRAEFFEYVRTDSGFFYPATDEGRESYIRDTRAYMKEIEGRLPDYFNILPKARLEVKRVESFREQPGGAAFYSAGAPDGSRPGVYYLHLATMSNNVDLQSTAYHEGLPGHHMQTAIAQELEGLPFFRTIASYTAFTEGWALYSEQLAWEMGLFTDPYMNFGRLNMELWRAVRLVVDTGIHAKGWSEEQAFQYFLANSASSEDELRSEIRRYFVWPGQATAYKVGMLKILELRRKAKDALGEEFDIREFHDTVLGSGSVPLLVLEKLVDDWIAAKKNNTA